MPMSEQKRYRIPMTGSCIQQEVAAGFEGERSLVKASSELI